MLVLTRRVGEEIVIGGLKRQVRVSNNTGIPFLKSLPIIGYAFGGETELNKNTEMVVAIQPVGIVDYKMAYNVAADDQSVIDMATGDKAVAPPETTVGFDMYGNPTKFVPVEPVK